MSAQALPDPSPADHKYGQTVICTAQLSRGQSKGTSGGDIGVPGGIQRILKKIDGAVLLQSGVREISAGYDKRFGQSFQNFYEIFSAFQSAVCLKAGHIQQKVTDLRRGVIDHGNALTSKKTAGKLYCGRGAQYVKLADRHGKTSFAPEYDGGIRVVLDFFRGVAYNDTRGEKYAEIGFYS